MEAPQRRPGQDPHHPKASFQVMADSILILLEPGLCDKDVADLIAIIRKLKGVVGVEADPSEITGQISQVRVKTALQNSLKTVLDKAKK